MAPSLPIQFASESGIELCVMFFDPFGHLTWPTIGRFTIRTKEDALYQDFPHLRGCTPKQLWQMVHDLNWRWQDQLEKGEQHFRPMKQGLVYEIACVGMQKYQVRHLFFLPSTKVTF